MYMIILRWTNFPKKRTVYYRLLESYRQAPFVRKKSVVPKSEKFKNNATESVRVMSG